MKKLLFLVLFISFLFSFSFSSCSNKSETKGKTCNPICDTWQICNDDGNCELKKDMCSTNADCKDGVNTVCNELHICEKMEENNCDPSCEEWQSCNNGSCELKTDRCNTDDDCIGVTTICNEFHSCATDVVTQVTSVITQFGITWTFDKNYEYGQFANGDYWVLGPVNIIEISPASTVMTDNRVINGSMINASPELGAVQGYDSATYGSHGNNIESWNANLNVARPNGNDLSASNILTVQANSSLMSSISFQEVQGQEGSSIVHYTDVIAILTVLESPAAEGSFRPAYSGSDKTIQFNKSDLDYSKLAQLAPVANMPSLSTVEDYFEKPWIDHVPGWLTELQHPIGNMPNYGREIASQIGEASLMLNLNFTNEEKEKLLIRFVQLGIDLFGIVENGGENNWTPNGGHAHGRKWPILFAGLMLNHAGMTNIGQRTEVLFGEDAQTFYISQAEIDITNSSGWSPRNSSFGGDPETYSSEDIGIPEWGIRHATRPTMNNFSWNAVYRRCCTANSWNSHILSAHIMGAKELWNHNAIFDYQDRFMSTEVQGEWTRSSSDFSENMWDAYRSNYSPIWTE